MNAREKTGTEKTERGNTGRFVKQMMRRCLA